MLAVGLVAAALASTAPVALTAFAVMGAGFLLGVASFTTVLQRRVPEALRGRVMALWTVAFLGNRPVAAVVDGAVADALGVRAAMGVPILVALGGAWAAWRLRRDGAEPASAEPSGAEPESGRRDPAEPELEGGDRR